MAGKVCDNKMEIEEVLETISIGKRLPRKSILQNIARTCKNQELWTLIAKIEDEFLIEENGRFERCSSFSSIVELLLSSSEDEGENFSPSIFEGALELFESQRYLEGSKALINIRRQLKNPNKILLANVFFKPVQIMILDMVKTAENQINLTSTSVPNIGVLVRAESGARIDLSGGWTDTPPICGDFGGKVCGISVLLDGQRPIGCEAKRIEKGQIVLKMSSNKEVILEEFADLLDYCDPTASGALLKAAVVFSGMVPQGEIGQGSLENDLIKSFKSGFEIRTWSKLPEGSGLGTSSILAGCILAALWTLTGKGYSHADLIHGVLMIEQLLTTGGGWQDQVNGLWPGGIKLAKSPKGEDLEVIVQDFEGPKGFLNTFGQRLLLVFTGKIRLAKNLLQTVLRAWYTAEVEVVKTLEENYDLADKCWEACKNGDLQTIGNCMNRYWMLKKFLAGDQAEPEVCAKMMKATEEFCIGQCLAGAGGGGFLILLLKDASSQNSAREAVKRVAPDDVKVTCHSVEIDCDGLQVKIEDQLLNIPRN